MDSTTRSAEGSEGAPRECSAYGSSGETGRPGSRSRTVPVTRASPTFVRSASGASSTASPAVNPMVPSNSPVMDSLSTGIVSAAAPWRTASNSATVPDTVPLVGPTTRSRPEASLRMTTVTSASVRSKPTSHASFLLLSGDASSARPPPSRDQPSSCPSASVAKRSSPPSIRRSVSSTRFERRLIAARPSRTPSAAKSRVPSSSARVTPSKVIPRARLPRVDAIESPTPESPAALDHPIEAATRPPKGVRNRTATRIARTIPMADRTYSDVRSTRLDKSVTSG